MDAQRSRVTPRLVMGMLIIAAGVLVMLNNLHVLDVSRYVDFWPLALVVVGIAHLAQARASAPQYFAGIIWIIAGAWLLLFNLAIIHVSFWEAWPLLLIFVGAYLVWQAAGRGRRPVEGSTSDGVVKGMAILGGVHRSSSAADFRGGDLVAIMGGCKLDLRNASISSGDAVLDVLACWGGIEVRVPEDWTVVGNVFALLGGFDDKTRPPKIDSGKRLVVRGFALMGGVDLRN